jgi:HEAT repeat protein
MSRLRSLLPVLVVVLLTAAVYAFPAPIEGTDEATARDLRDLQRGDQLSKIAALHHISLLGGRSAGLVPTLITALADPEPRVRSGAAKLLGRIGEGAAQAGDALIDRLKDPDRRVPPTH